MEQIKERKHWFLKFPIIPAIVVPFAAILVTSTFANLFTAGILEYAPEWENAGSELYSIFSAVMRILIAFLIIGAMKISSGRTFWFGFRRKNIGLSFLLSLFCLFMIADNIIEGIVFGEGFKTAPIGIFAAVIGGFAPGFFEEVVCRGLVLSNMMDKWKGKKNAVLKSVLASGIIFGLIHFMNIGSDVFRATLMQVCYAAGMGIYFGAVYVRTRNLWGTVVMHALIDIASFMVIWPDGFHIQDLISGIAIAVGFTIVGLYLIRPKKHEEIKRLWEQEEREADFGKGYRCTSQG